MALSILGLGPVCSLGSGIASFKNGLLGEIKPNIVDKQVVFQGKSLTLPVYQPVIENLENHFPARSLRRLDHFAQMVLLSASLAMQDAGVTINDRSRIGIIFGTGYGPIRTTFQFLDRLIDEGDKFASPFDFANSVHNTPASQISIMMKINGMCTTLTCFDNTVVDVFMTAENWLNHGLMDYVLACMGDEYCDVLGYAAAGLGASKVTHIRPFQFDECSYLPGEGCISFLLSKDSSIKGKYGNLERVQFSLSIDEIDPDFLKGFDAVILAAKGKQSEGKTFQKLKLNNVKTAAYSPLYGSMPVGSAFDLASAALMLSENKLYTHPERLLVKNEPFQVINDDIQHKPVSRISCIEYSDSDRVNIYNLSKTWSQ